MLGRAFMSHGHIYSFLNEMLYHVLTVFRGEITRDVWKVWRSYRSTNSQIKKWVILVVKWHFFCDLRFTAYKRNNNSWWYFSTFYKLLLQLFAFLDGKHQGFGIVQFLEVGDASTAMKEMNSKFILSKSWFCISYLQTRHHSFPWSHLNLSVDRAVVLYIILTNSAP